MHDQLGSSLNSFFHVLVALLEDVRIGLHGGFKFRAEFENEFVGLVVVGCDIVR